MKTNDMGLLEVKLTANVAPQLLKRFDVSFIAEPSQAIVHQASAPVEAPTIASGSEDRPLVTTDRTVNAV